MDEQENNAPMGRPVIIQPAGRKNHTGFLGGCLCGCLLSLLLPVMLCFMAVGSCSLLTKDSASLMASRKSSLDEKVLRPGTGDRRIAVVPIAGIIGHFNSNIFAETRNGDADRILKELRQIAETPDVCAVILDVNTPGGEVVASDEIRTALDKLSVPVVTCMHSMAASGGYYIASGSDWIVANPMTLTGSIGVIMNGMECHGLLDKLGVKPVVYKSGAFKDILSGSREATEAESAYLNQMVQADFTHFCQVVSEGRKAWYPTVDAVKAAEFGDGRPLSGEDALKANLVDALGDFEDAVAKARELGDCPNAPVVRLGGNTRFAEFFLDMCAPRQAPKVQIDGLSPSQVLPLGNRFYLMPEALH